MLALMLCCQRKNISKTPLCVKAEYYELTGGTDFPSHLILSGFFWDWPGIFRSRLWREPVICVLFHFGLRGFHNSLIARKFSKTRLRAEIEERKRAGGGGPLPWY
jgi:hypothetical protein